MISIAIGQIAVRNDVEENKSTIISSIEQAMQSDTDYIIFPEYALSGPPSSTIIGHSSAHFSNQIDDRHDKCVITPAESFYLMPGQSVSICQVLPDPLAILLCAEGNGSELFTALSFAGAKIIVHASYPDSLPGNSSIDGTDLWEIEVASVFPIRSRIRALGEQIYIFSVVPANSGSVSRVISPRGIQLVKAHSQEPELIYVRIDTDDFPLRETAMFEQRRSVFLKSMQRLFSDS